MNREALSAAVRGRVRCPSCGVVLQVPRDYDGSPVRCAKCRRRFQVTVSHVSEEEILSWLDEDVLLPPELAMAASSRTPIRTDQAKKPRAPEPITAARGEIRLIKFDRASALFEFPARRLEEPRFRCAMPRRCLQCGARAHLRAHVIIYAPQLITSISLEEEHAAGPMVVSDQDVQDLNCEELLDRLPRVPNVPHPGDLPMPYWLCDMCAASGSLSGQIQVNTATGEGWCRLLIRNLRRAEEFMAAAGGAGSGEHQRLKEHLAEIAETPWELVPLVIRHRIQQWFGPGEGERFLGYVPDRDHARTEDGMVGLVVSTQRLVHHTALTHRECSRGEPVELELAMGHDTGNLQIHTPSWQVRHFAIDRGGLVDLRHALTAGKFQASWR